MSTKKKQTFGFTAIFSCLGIAAIVFLYLTTNEAAFPPAVEADVADTSHLDAKAETESKPAEGDLKQSREPQAAAKAPSFPTNANEMAEFAAAEKKRQQAVLESEESSLRELKNLEGCFSPHLFKMFSHGEVETQKQIPAELAQRLPLMLQSSCLVTALRIVSKYPKFREKYEKDFLAKAKPEAVKMAREQAVRD